MQNDVSNRYIANTTSHNDRAFNLGNIISAELNMIGNNKLPNPPINTGITKQKIMNIP